MRKVLKTGLHYFSVMAVLLWSTGFVLPAQVNSYGIQVARAVEIGNEGPKNQTPAPQGQVQQQGEQGGQPDKITICHATGSGYVTNQPNRTADAGGHAGIEHQDGRDIIPPFDYDGGFFPGQNWDTEGQAIYDNGCVVPDADPVCGDGVINQETEECDGQDFGDLSCSDFGDFSGGGLVCSESCTIDTSQCTEEPQDPVCGNEIVEDGEQCDDGNTEGGDGCDSQCQLEDPEPEPVQIKAYKVVCQDERFLPNWGDGSGPEVISETTAQDFLDSVNNPTSDHENCWFEEGWSFQWGFQNVKKLTGGHIGEADGSEGEGTYTGAGINEWKTFDSTTLSDGTPAMASIVDEYVESTDHLWVRENLQEGYVPFSYPPDETPGSDVSAEIYCHSDVFKYDNYDRIDDPAFDSTFYCVAFNALEEDESEYSPYCGDGEVNQSWEQCEPGDEGCTEQCRWEEQNECSDLTLAKVDIEGLLNQGTGNMTDDLFLGSSSYKIPNNVWFATYWNGSYMTDADVASYEDVPGLAVQRLEGSLRTVMYGTATTDDLEHIDGKISFWNAVPLSQASDNSNDNPGLNKLENAFNGTGVGSFNPTNDEVWLDNNESWFWLTTDTADDGFYTNYAVIEDCNEDDPTAPWCSALLGIWKEAYENDNYSDIADVNDDQVVDMADYAILAQWYLNADDETCYEQFEDPEGEFHYSCVDYKTIGWCQGVFQGLQDFMGTIEGDGEYAAMYDLNDDGKIDVVDLGMFAQYMPEGENGSYDQLGCFGLLVPPLEVPQCEEEYSPYCGDGSVNQDWEQCEPGDEGCTEQCRWEEQDECSDLALAKIDITAYDNFEGNGDMSSDLFLGSSSYMIPDDVWFAVYWNGSAITDADIAGYEDVPGLAVQRLSNKVRTVMYGTHEDGSWEHVQGNVEFWNADVTGQSNDASNGHPGLNNLEAGFNGTKGVNPLNDEVWIDEGISYFWLTTELADDGFYTNYSVVEDCREDEEQAPWCSALLGIWKEAYENDNYSDIADVNNDQVVDMTDFALLMDWYFEADDESCYMQFEDPEGEFHYSCQDYETIGWCQGVWQGLQDFINTEEGDGTYTSLYDLNDDGKINVIDLAVFAQYMPASEEGSYDQVGCLELLVPPLEVPQCEEENPICGNEVVESGEQCDDGNTIGGDGCSAQCTTEGGGGGGGQTFPPRIQEPSSTAQCSETPNVSWTTSHDSYTWIQYGADTNLGIEYKSDTMTQSHSFDFADLVPGTTYYYKIFSQGTNGQIGQTGILSFETPTAESCGGGGGEPGEPGGNGGTPPEPEVLGVQELGCSWHRPSGSFGYDSDVEGQTIFPDGTLIRGCDSPEVYLMRSKMKWHVKSWNWLHENVEGQRIYNAPQHVVDAIPNWTGEVLGAEVYADGTLLRGPDGRIYIIEDGVKKHIASLEELQKYAGQPIIDVTQEVLDAY